MVSRIYSLVSCSLTLIVMQIHQAKARNESVCNSIMLFYSRFEIGFKYS